MSTGPVASLALSPAQRSEIRRIVDAAVPGARVWVFGSRAAGRARPFSDVDLLLQTRQPLAWDEWAALECVRAKRFALQGGCGGAAGFAA